MATTISEDIEYGPAEGQNIRSWLKTLKQRHGMTADEIVFQTCQSDPCWRGTPDDHEKADWAAGYFRRMIKGRKDDYIHTRGMHYFLISLDEDVPPPTDNPQREWDVYENTTTCYQALVNALICARVLGKIPVDAVRDESAIVTEIEGARRWSGTQEPHSRWSDDRNITSAIAHVPGVSGISSYEARPIYDTFEEAIEDIANDIASKAASNIHINTRRLRPYYIEVWSEKTLPSEVESIIRKYPVGRYVQGSGHSGWYHVNQFVSNVQTARTPGYLLYLADWDSAGEDMPVGVASKIEFSKHERGIDQPIKLDKLGLTENQIEEYDLPQNFEKDEPYVELNALEAQMDVFCDIVRDGLEALTADMNRVRDEIDAEIDHIISTIYRQAKAELMAREHELRPLYDAAHDVVERYNELSEERRRAYDTHVAGYTTELRELGDDDRLDEWYEIIEDIPDEIRYPAAHIPDVEPDDEPTNPLYDSSRAYIENSRRLNDVSE